MRGADRAIRAEVLSVSGVDIHLREQLHQLFVSGYDGVSRKKFDADFIEKTHVIVLRTNEGAVCGFSTLTELKRQYCGQEVALVFNGDSIIDPKHWGSPTLFRAWLRYLLDRHDSNPPGKTFWFLTTKGHRVFRMLPLFFNRFWPAWSPDRTDHALEGLAHEIGMGEFPDRYESATGRIKVAPFGERLSPDLAEIPKKDACRDDVGFFLKANPNYRLGEELLCLARITPDNLTSFAKKYLENR